MKIPSSIINERTINAFQKIHAEFKEVLKHEKCRSCSCFHADALNRVIEKLKAYRQREADLRLAAIEEDFEGWVKEADFLKMHG